MDHTQEVVPTAILLPSNQSKSVKRDVRDVRDVLLRDKVEFESDGERTARRNKNCQRPCGGGMQSSWHAVKVRIRVIEDVAYCISLSVDQKGCVEGSNTPTRSAGC